MVPLVALLLAQDAGVVPLSCLVPGTTLRVERRDRPLLVLTEAGKESVEVRKPDDLRGHVAIDSAPKALEYVRLFRTPGLWPFFFDKPIVEIRRQPVLFAIPRWLYGDLRIYTVSGWDGVVSDRDWTRLGLSEPKMAGGGGKDWSIHRPCLLREGEKYRTGTLVERVSDAGRYVWSVERPEDAPRGVGWNITLPAKR